MSSTLDKSTGTSKEAGSSEGGDVDLNPILKLGDRIPAGRTRYGHLQSVMRGLIEKGIWPVGGKLPNEESVANVTGFSLGTVQRALGGLAGSGFLSRSPGRGTFVSFKALELDEPLHCRFERDDESGYIPVFTKLLSRGRRTAPSPFNELLGGSASEFVCVERLIEISSEFTVHSLLLFPYPRYSALLEIPVDIFNTLNIKKLLFQELGVSVRRINQRLRIGQIAPAVAGLIGVEQGSTGLLMRTAGFSEEETVIYGQELSIPTTERWLVVNSMSQV